MNDYPTLTNNNQLVDSEVKLLKPEDFLEGLDDAWKIQNFVLYNI